MFRIPGDSPVIDRFLQGSDAVLFDLLSALREYPTVKILTDGETFLFMQTSPDMAPWIVTLLPVTGTSARALADELRDILTDHPSVRIHTRTGQHMDEVLSILSESYGFALTRAGGLIAYFNTDPILPPCRGCAVHAEPHHAPRIAELIRDAARVTEHREMPEEEAEAFAESKIGSPDFYLWEDEGQAVAMAQIAHRSARYARINAVGTLTPFRGRGYAGMLVSHLCRAALAEGLIPMLYADADYPSSNRAYQKIGFQSAGEIIEYGLQR